MPFVIGQQADQAPGSIAFPCSAYPRCLSKPGSSTSSKSSVLWGGSQGQARAAHWSEGSTQAHSLSLIIYMLGPQAPPARCKMDPCQDFLEDEATQPSVRCRDWMQLLTIAIHDTSFKIQD